MSRLIAIVAICVGSSGCMLMPEALQPHQLWKLNRQPPSSHEDAFFSVEDLPRPTSKSFSNDAKSKATKPETDASSDPFVDLYN